MDRSGQPHTHGDPVFLGYVLARIEQKLDTLTRLVRALGGNLSAAEEGRLASQVKTAGETLATALEEQTNPEST